MTFIEKLESFQQQLIGVGQTAAACDLQNIIEEYKNAQEPPVAEVTVRNFPVGTQFSATWLNPLPDGEYKLFTHPPLSDETVKVPEGYAMVPREPTDAMLIAAGNEIRTKAIYKAMIDEAMKAES